MKSLRWKHRKQQQKDKRQPNPQLRANAFVCSREKSMKHLIKISSVSRHGCNFVSSNDHRAWSWCHVILPLEETITLLPITSAPESVSMSTKPRSNASPSSRGA